MFSSLSHIEVNSWGVIEPEVYANVRVTTDSN